MKRKNAGLGEGNWSGWMGYAGCWMISIRFGFEASELWKEDNMSFMVGWIASGVVQGCWKGR